MVLAFRADAPVGIQILLPHNRAAIFALGPQPFRLHAARIGRRGLVDSLFFPLEPSHGGRVLQAARARFQKFTSLPREWTSLGLRPQFPELRPHLWRRRSEPVSPRA